MLRHARSKLNHFKIFLAGTALRADPIHGNIFPKRASGDAFIRHSRSLIVDPATDEAHPSTKFVHVVHNQLAYNELIVAIGI